MQRLVRGTERAGGVARRGGCRLLGQVDPHERLGRSVVAQLEERGPSPRPGVGPDDGPQVAETVERQVPVVVRGHDVERAVAEVADMGALADAVAAWPVDAVMINTDGFSYGGSADDLRRACQLLRQAPRPQFVARELDLLARSADVDVAAGRDPSGSWTGAAAAPPPPPPSDEEDPTRPPTLCPVIMKDIELHPLQVAQAAEAGACAVYLIACVVGAQLESLLGYATVMGLEAIVEVHTPEEVEFAVGVGATVGRELGAGLGTAKFWREELKRQEDRTSAEAERKYGPRASRGGPP